ncbi:MAG TPA: hypothetical protein VF804_11385 [Holophagaceae bacterium]
MSGARTRSWDDPVLDRMDSALAGILVAPGPVPSVAVLAAAVGVDESRLGALFQVHVHAAPETFLRRASIRAACLHLVAGGAARDLDAQAFRRETGLSPDAYRALLATGRFELALPPDFRAADLLRFHGRDAQSVSERVEGTTLRKAYLAEGQPAVLNLAFGDGRVAVSLEGGPGTRSAFAGAHAASLRLLGWHGDPGPFEAAHPHLARGREGLRIPLTLDPFEALVWAIVGQQVNLAFAYALRRDLIRLAGLPAGHGLIAHPDPAHLATLAPEALQALRFSRRKAEYLIGAAQAVAGGRLCLEALPTATGAARELLALRGCGTWTAQYVLMRGLGFGDCVPLGDAALTLALQRAFSLPERPDAAATARLLAPFTPHRSLATFHLWASLKGIPA